MRREHRKVGISFRYPSIYPPCFLNKKPKEKANSSYEKYESQDNLMAIETKLKVRFQG